MNQTLIKKGFTLIELLVVIAIIGILTAIISANFTLAKSKARDSKRISDLSQIQLALELAFDKCSTYPEAPLVLNNNVCTGYPLNTFISVLPRDTYRNQAYSYGVDGSSAGTRYDYRLSAELENPNSMPTASAPSAYNITCTGNFYCVSPK